MSGLSSGGLRFALFLYFGRHISIVASWLVDGTVGSIVNELLVRLSLRCQNLLAGLRMSLVMSHRWWREVITVTLMVRAPFYDAKVFVTAGIRVLQTRRNIVRFLTRPFIVGYACWEKKIPNVVLFVGKEFFHRLGFVVNSCLVRDIVIKIQFGLLERAFFRPRALRSFLLVSWRSERQWYVSPHH